MELLTAKDVAKKLSCSQEFVYKNYKQLGGFKIGRLTRFQRSDFEEKMRRFKNDNLETSGRIPL